MLEDRLVQFALRFLKANLDADVVDALNEANSLNWPEESYERTLEKLAKDQPGKQVPVLRAIRFAHDVEGDRRAEAAGQAVIKLLGLRPEENGRYMTNVGDKTAKGLARTITDHLVADS